MAEITLGQVVGESGQVHGANIHQIKQAPADTVRAWFDRVGKVRFHQPVGKIGDAGSLSLGDRGMRIAGE